jgi:hypothetical protein
MIVGKHKDEAHPESANRVFERSDDGLRDCLPRVSDHKKITQSEVENDFGGQSRISASEQGRKRLLSAGECIPVVNVLPGMCERAADEAAVAGHKLLPCLARSCGSSFSHHQPFPVT